MPLCDNVEKNCRAGQATDDNIGSIWHMCFTYQITETRLQYLVLFHGNNSYASATHCYVYKYAACLTWS